jgi:hypothetical protein
MNRTIPLQIAILLMLSAFIASSQISFTGTYNFSYSPHRSIHMTCCENGSPVQFGLTSVIHDIPVAGPGVQITSLIITGTVQVASPDITNNAPFDWEVFIGSSPSTLPRYAGGNHESNGLAASQRARVHQRNAGQEDGADRRIRQRRGRRAPLFDQGLRRSNPGSLEPPDSRPAAFLVLQDPKLGRPV